MNVTARSVAAAVLAVVLLCGFDAKAADGALATGFGTGGFRVVSYDVGGTLNDQALAIGIQPDGRILLGGFATGAAANYDFAITRLTAAGAIDSGFGTAGKVRVDFGLGGFDDSIKAMAVQEDGKIVAVGRASFADGSSDRYAFGIIRLTAGGAPDLGFDLDGRALVDFDPGGSLSADAVGVVVQSNGKIVIAGSTQSSSTADIALARLNADGSPDLGFNGTGHKIIPLPTAAIPQALMARSDGSLVLAGAIFDAGLTNIDMLAVQLTSDGDLDPGFGSGGYRRITFDQGGSNGDIARSMAIDAAGRVVLAGSAAVAGSGAVQNQSALVRLTPTGDLDGSFGSGGRLLLPVLRAGVDVGNGANGVAIDASGRVVIAGEAGPSDDSGDRDVLVARLLDNGTLDETFGDSGRKLIAVDLGPSGNTVDAARAVAVDAGGRIITAGIEFIDFTLNYDMLAVALVGDTLFSDGFD